MPKTTNEDLFCRCQSVYLNNNPRKRKDVLQKEMSAEWKSMKIGNAIDRDAVEITINQLRAIADVKKAKAMLQFLAQRKPFRWFSLSHNVRDSKKLILLYLSLIVELYIEENAFLIAFHIYSTVHMGGGGG